MLSHTLRGSGEASSLRLDFDRSREFLDGLGTGILDAEEAREGCYLYTGGGQREGGVP